MSGPTYTSEKAFFTTYRPKPKRFSRAITRKVQTCPKCYKRFFMLWQPQTCREHYDEERV